MLNAKDVRILKDLHALLKPFHVTIMKLQKDRDFTSSLVYGDLMELIEHTSSFKSSQSELVSAARSLQKGLTDRFKQFLELKQDSISTYILSSMFDVSKGFLLQDMPQDHLIQLLQNEIQPTNRESVTGDENDAIQPIITGSEIVGKFAQRMFEKRRMLKQTTNDSYVSIAKSFVTFSLSSDIQACAKTYWKDTGSKQFVKFVSWSSFNCFVFSH